MRFVLFFIFALSISAARAQRVLPIKAKSLLERISADNDTLYIVNFWATWCGPCVNELPAFEKLATEHRAEKVKLILVSVDFRSLLEKKVDPFVIDKKLKSEVLLLDEKDQQGYINLIDSSWSGAIPATIFIKNGKRKFFESEFTYSDLLNAYLNFKKS